MDIITYALCQANDKKLEDLIKSMEGLSTVILDHVPTVSEAEPNKLYLVDVNHDNVYEEYILAEIDGQEQIVELGAFIDLSNYYTKTEVNSLVDVHSVLTQSEYDALTPEEKNNGKEYFVYGTSPALEWSDGVHAVKTEIVGWKATSGEISYISHTTTKPEIAANGTTLVFKTTSADGTFYHTDMNIHGGGEGSQSEFAVSAFTPWASNADANASNISFMPTEDNKFVLVDSTNGGIAALGQGGSLYDFSLPVTLTGYSMTSETQNKIYKNSKKYADTNPPALNVSYINTASGLNANNVQDAIDEVSTVANAHVILTESEYNALTPEQKNNGKEYFVTGKASELTWKDTNNHIVKMEILGWTSTAGMQYAQHITTAPEINGGNFLVFKTTSPEGVYYHSNLTGANFPGYPNPGDFSPRADNSDIYARNVYFQIEENGYFTLRTTQGSVYSVYQGPPYLCTPWYDVTNYSLDTHFNNKIFKDGEKFAEVNPPASEISFDNVTSGLSAKNIQDAVDEVADNATKAHVNITQAEYDLLTPEEKNNGTEYFITDASAEGNFSDLETRLTHLEDEFVVIYQSENEVIYLYLQNTTKVEKVDDNTVEWYITDPATHRNFKATVTATGEGSVRTNPQVVVTEVV